MFATDFQTAISNHLSLALRIVKLLIRLLYRLTIKFQTRTIVNNACILKERRNRSLFYILSFFFFSLSSIEDQRNTSRFQYTTSRQMVQYIAFHSTCQWPVTIQLNATRTTREREREGKKNKCPPDTFSYR